MSLAALRQRLADVITPPPVAGGGVRTGIAALDAALSDGGLPCGRLTDIVGPRGSGKTTLVRAIVAQALADKRWVAYIDAGRTLAPADWAALAETDRLWIVRPPPASPASPSRPSRPSRPSAPPSPPGATGPAGRAAATPHAATPHAATPRAAAPRAAARLAAGARDGTGIEAGDPLPVAHGPWCADVLLRSGTFGLVVLDGAGALTRGVVVRLTRLARESHAAFVVLRDSGGDGEGRGRTGELVGGAVRLRVGRRPRGRYGGTGTVGGAVGGAMGGVMGGMMGGGERREPVPPSGRTAVVLDVSVEKGGTHQVVEVGCAIEVARRLCAHPQVPDRRGVAARNRRGERVAPDAPGVRRTTPPPDGAGGRGGATAHVRQPSAPPVPAAPLPASPASPAHHARAIPPASGATLAHKRRCAEPAIHRDEFLLRR